MTGRSPRTVDYEISVVKTMFTKAFHHQKIDGKPVLIFKLVKRKLKTGRNARSQTLSCGDYLNLISCTQQHLRSIIITAFHTGMRLGELLGLRWPYVDCKAAMIRLPAELVKTENPRRIPSTMMWKRCWPPCPARSTMITCSCTAALASPASRNRS